ncbi:MAG: hypothetical protein EBT32_09525 [Betaproteobacteria bacterium]|nr:hypothetical protein [Betaproteobacteria bacterium]
MRASRPRDVGVALRLRLAAFRIDPARLQLPPASKGLVRCPAGRSSGAGQRIRKAAAAIAEWLKERARWLSLQPSGDQHALFLGLRGQRISARSIQHRFVRLGLEGGLATRLHPHVLRHSFASDLLQSSGDLRAVQELLGHASIASTQIYTALDFQRLAAVYDQAHPRAARRSS